MTEKTKQMYEVYANIYKVLSNGKRLEILSCIKDRERSVDDIAKEVGIRKANLSQHLSILRLNKLVTHRRDGQKIFYKCIDPGIVEPCKIIETLRTKGIV